MAYPEMVRHGYVNCTSCHVSPAGGGVLTPYGRVLSGEILSTWAKEGEGDFAYGALKSPDWLALGGDVRWIQTYRNMPNYREARFTFMQADVEAAATFDKFTVGGTFGWSDMRSRTNFGDGFLSRRHYVMYKPTDKWTIRAGRFPVAYGLMIADHYASVKRGLGFDQGTETYNVEGSWLGESADVYMTAVLGRPDKESLDREYGAALRGSLAMGERYKFGAGYYYGNNRAQHRHLFGPYAILGFTPHFFLLGELNYQITTADASNLKSSGIVGYWRLDYEFLQGLHGFATYEVVEMDFPQDSNAVGLGVQWFPRPHFELTTSYQRVVPNTGSGYDVAWFLFHFYP